MRALVAVSAIVAITLALLLSGLGVPALHGGNASPAASGPSPAIITPKQAWEGIDYNASCASCLEADAQLASGAGYVVEVVNGSFEIWTLQGAELLAGSLDSLFHAGTDRVAYPQIRYDGFDLRWFATADDLRSDQILFAASDTSDPTAGWNVQRFTVAANEIPERSMLGVDALDLVATADLFSRSSGAFLGAQVWVANKTELTSGSAVSVWSSAVNASAEALAPAQPLTDARSLYLATDGTGTTSSLDLELLTGSPPATPVLSTPLQIPVTLTSAPNAVQANSSELVQVGDGRIASAVWKSGTLWAVATEGCRPAGDAVLRSCLHLWEISTPNGVVEQSFTWSSGAGTYDFYPALSINGTGDLTLVFGESSARLDPSVFVTGQTNVDPMNTLETPTLLRVGTGPDAPSAGCSAGVCPFGATFSVAWTVFSGVRFWVVGEYTSTDSSSVFWHTWVASVNNVETYPVTFSESGLGAGDSWSVTLNGVETTSNTSSISLEEPRGACTFSVLSPIPGVAGTRYVATPTTGSFAVSDGPIEQQIAFTEQYRLSTSVLPAAAGIVEPLGAWEDAGSSVSLGALANSSYAFRTWDGSGAGSYTGTSNPAEVEMVGPITETASFVNSTTYLVDYSETGLPSGTTWSATLNGLVQSSAAESITFNVTNGSYTYVVESPISGGPDTQYATPTVDGSFSVDGAGVPVAVPYTTEYLLTTGALPDGGGSVSPATSWIAAGSLVNLSAVPASGYAFDGWNGSGAGNYTGSDDPAAVSMHGPVQETALFRTSSVTFANVTFGVSPADGGLIAFEGADYAADQWIMISAGVYSISAPPSPGYEFIQWTAGGAITLGPGIANVSGDGWINATFEAVHLVSIVTAPTSCGSVSVGGNVYGNAASLVLPNGTYDLTATACSGFSLLSVVGSGGVTVFGDRMNITGNGSVVATFTPKLTTNAAGNASTSGLDLALLLLAFGALASALVYLVIRGPRNPPPVAGAAPALPEQVPDWSEDGEPIWVRRRPPS